LGEARPPEREHTTNFRLRLFQHKAYGRLKTAGRLDLLFDISIQLPYRRLAPIGGAPLDKKQLGMFLQIFNILQRKLRSISK
jgi:hypothetical protein